MRILITFATRYPLQSALMLLALLFAGIVEGFGLTALMPLLGMAFSSQPQAAVLQPTASAGVNRRAQATGPLLAQGVIEQ